MSPLPSLACAQATPTGKMGQNGHPVATGKEGYRRERSKAWAEDGTQSPGQNVLWIQRLGVCGTVAHGMLMPVRPTRRAGGGAAARAGYSHITSNAEQVQLMRTADPRSRAIRTHDRSPGDISLCTASLLMENHFTMREANVKWRHVTVTAGRSKNYWKLETVPGNTRRFLASPKELLSTQAKSIALGVVLGKKHRIASPTQRSVPEECSQSKAKAYSGQVSAPMAYLRDQHHWQDHAIGGF